MLEIDSNILITGGSGFIGTHLTRYLQKQGYKNITIVDVIKPQSDNVTFVNTDFSNFEVMANLLKKTDYVFHLAAIVGVDRCRLNPIAVRKVNRTNAKKFIDLCINNGIKRFIFSSSSEVYGNSKDIPYREDTKLSPISEYAKSKVDVESYLNKIASKSNMTVGIVRFFNIYGPGQRKDFVVTTFINNAIKNDSLTILGDGNQTRCFTYVKDAVEGLFLVFKYNKKPFEIFNIGNSTEYYINDLAKTVLKCLPKSKSNIVYNQYGNNFRESSLEINRRVPAVEKALNLLGFKATTTLKKGIDNIISNLVSDENI